jgi:alcohol dehydrogenase
MLPSVVRWNGALASGPYAELVAASGRPGGATELADRLEALAVRGGLPRRLGALGVGADAIPDLAADAAREWTGTFNPRPFDAAAARDLYQAVS